MINKKGSSFSGWIEGSLFGILLILAFTLIVVDMNGKYQKEYEVPFVGNTTTWNNLADSLQTKSDQGEVEFSSYTGITLKSSWAMIQLISAAVWGVITGGWINIIIHTLHLQPERDIIIILTTLFRLSIFLIFLYIVTRVKT
jgi:hypothetical protein